MNELDRGCLHDGRRIALLLGSDETGRGLVFAALCECHRFLGLPGKDIGYLVHSRSFHGPIG